MNPLRRALATRRHDDQSLLPVILREVRGFCGEHVDPARIDREGRLGGDLLAAIARQGWFGLTVPEEHGGVGLSLSAATQVVAELAGHDGSVGTCVGLHSGLAMHALLHLATPELQARYLPEIAEGRRICAFAATEPGAGSDIASVKTTLSEASGKLRLSGTKCYVTNGAMAGLVTVLARSPGLGGAKAGHTLVAVDPRWPGVQRGPEEHKLGLKGSSTLTIDFDDVEIPADHVLGEPSQGLVHAHRALGWGRTFMAAGCLGATRAAYEDVKAHVETRQQFGRPLARFPLVRASLAEMRAEIFAIERVLDSVCAPSGDAAAPTHEEIGLPSTIVKILASEGAWRVIDRAVQLMGGAGFIEDAGMSRRLRNVRVTRIFEGANDVLRLRLASDALAWKVAEVRDLAVRADIDAAVSSFLDTLEEVRKTWGFRLFERQGLQVHLADAIVALYAAVASRGDDDLSRFAVHEQLRRANEAIARARAPVDKELDALVARLA
ncbi:MAG: acyl-CoA dehydrogenase family protein [Deltaproteobacteria bacterium]|nr:acyl-CoA dehydrogenase family protein [Deltaproteobacteria bacterium]